ncbi:thermonuclease family protein [Mycoplasmopsis verecunda]|uniref:Nuclease homologue n=1 Tax=Mycoplasmopsis verecunda TaxID=171291 RepID=A0A1T4LK29_9BACT|nr:thermonuclease family protein [Mycoplasmopsis verecunda]WPB54424.1 thermonuclease family protein [Mycoplasmopsis verecunda]SJZ54907.1 nuclease homologue [Mycoplasmopsis verecunda]
MKKFKTILLALAGITVSTFPIIAASCWNDQNQKEPEKTSDPIDNPPVAVPIEPPSEDPVTPPETDPKPPSGDPAITPPISDPAQAIKLLSKQITNVITTQLLSLAEIKNDKDFVSYLDTKVSELDKLQNSTINIEQLPELSSKLTNEALNLDKIYQTFTSEDELNKKVKSEWIKFNTAYSKIVSKALHIKDHDLIFEESKAKYKDFINNLNRNYSSERYTFISNNQSPTNFVELNQNIIRDYKDFMKGHLPTNYAVLENINDVVDGDTIYGVIIGIPQFAGQDITAQYFPALSSKDKNKLLGIRFRGVDTPETFKPTRPDKNAKLAPKENEYAQLAKENLRKIVEDEYGIFYLKKTTEDKYGRWISFFFPDSSMKLAEEFGVQQVAAGLAQVQYIQDKNPNKLFYTNTPLEKEYYKFVLQVQQKAMKEKVGFWKENIKDVFHVG